MNALILSIFGLLAAALLIRYGLVKRVLILGGERRCSKCEYLLIGIDSDRCPECGTATSSAVRGRLERIWALVVLGVLIALISVLGVVGNWYRPFHTDSWYHLAPTRVLLWQQRFPQSHTSCWLELERRVAKGQLDAKQKALVFDSALRQVRAARPMTPVFNYFSFKIMNQCLQQLAADGKLAAPRAKKAYDEGIILLRLTARWNARDADVVAFYAFDFVPPAQARMWVSVKTSYRLDGKPSSSHQSTLDRTPPALLTAIDFSVLDPRKPKPAPGRHTLRADYTIDLYRGPKGDIAHSHRIKRCARTATTQFVVPAPSGK